MARPKAEPKLERPPDVAEDAILRLYRVPAEAAGMRLDVFFANELRNTSRTRARAIIEQSAYSLGGRRLSSSERVRSGEQIALWRAPFEDDSEQPPLNAVYEDPHLLVIDKPALVTVHPTARYHKHTVTVRLAAERPDEFLALIHRLDRETSGLLLLARTPESERAFKAMLEERSLGALEDDAEADDSHPSFEKEYLAIVRGTPQNGMVELPLELDPENSLRVKMRVAESGTGLSARTSVRVLETRGGYSLVACGLHTGRQHQIRIHLAALGHPLVGDKLYGPDERMLARAADGELSAEDIALLELPRHALHAHRYRLRHAVTSETLTISSPLPADLAEFWRRLAPD
ncbi:MAG: RluA family pseudouridine synthase [Polyangiaceae bacterium]